MKSDGKNNSNTCVLRIPPAASWLPIPLSPIGSQVKRRQSQSCKFKEFAKISNFCILKQTLHATHLLKLFDKMCKYEMYPTHIVEDTERTRFCPQTDRRTRWNSKVVSVTPISHFFGWKDTRTSIGIHIYINGLVQERCNSIANALELCLSCINPSTCVSELGHHCFM